MIYAVSFKHKIPEDVISMDVTSRSQTWGKNFSPFNLGPVDLYDDYTACNIENAFQFSRVYAEYNGFDDTPSQNYWEWAIKGWQNSKPIKYPLGVWSKHLYHWWDHKKLTNLEAQNQIFVPMYKKAVEKTPSFQRLKALYAIEKKDIYLIDFEGYNHRYLEKSWDQVINDPNRPIGQAFMLCMLLEGYL